VEKNKLNVILGGLLHDIGKPAQRGDKTISHSDAGYVFLKNMTDEKDILEQIKYHHSSAIKQNAPKNDSLAYITYIADNIASGADRRKSDDGKYGFDSEKALESVFNILNGNYQKYEYRPVTMDERSGINYPESKGVKFSREIYHKICGDIADCIKGADIHDEKYINSFLEVMEADCSFIPSSTKADEVADISLYDHSKITAAVGACIYDYLKENGITDYKKELYDNSKDFYKKKAFLMCSFDVSGIQDFIYTIHSKGTLKLLRSRSFYIEMLCEHLIDVILENLELSRANLIYSGGGHGYILLPDTNNAKKTVDRIHNEINEWFIKKYKTALYIAMAYTECSADDLMNTDNGYSDIFKSLAEKLSSEKSNRYTSEQIRKMNFDNTLQGERECKICRHEDEHMNDDVCSICQKLMDNSDDIIHKDFFVVMKNDKGLPLPFGMSLIPADIEYFKTKLMPNDKYVRCYSKNKQYTGMGVTSKLWVGDYCKEKEFTKLIENASGIEKIGVMRADVDNLGKAFVEGFDEKYTSLSRTATFSRNLSLFFKKHINTLLAEKDYNALIVYSGGDDIFLVSSWEDAIPAALTLKNALERFTQNKLKISAGIGIYPPKYPISSMAYESGELESESKNSGRNRITLFSPDNSEIEKHTYGWDELEDKVIGEKKKCLEDYFSCNDEHGKNMLYNMLEYLRNIDDKINIARYAYLLSRIEPEDKTDNSINIKYNIFFKNMYKWMCSKDDRQQLITAIYLYIYEIRETNKEESENELL